MLSAHIFSSREFYQAVSICKQFFVPSRPAQSVLKPSPFASSSLSQAGPRPAQSVLKPSPFESSSLSQAGSRPAPEGSSLSQAGPRPAQSVLKPSPFEGSSLSQASSLPAPCPEGSSLSQAGPGRLIPKIIQRQLAYFAQLSLQAKSLCQFSSAPEISQRQSACFASLLCRLKNVRQRLLQLAVRDLE